MMMTKKCGICYAVVILASLGAINGALTTLMGMDLVYKVTTTIPILYKVFYGLVGVSGIVLLVTTLFKPCPCTK